MRTNGDNRTPQGYQEMDREALDTLAASAIDSLYPGTRQCEKNQWLREAYHSGSLTDKLVQTAKVNPVAGPVGLAYGASAIGVPALLYYTSQPSKKINDVRSVSYSLDHISHVEGRLVSALADIESGLDLR